MSRGQGWVRIMCLVRCTGKTGLFLEFGSCSDVMGGQD